MNINNPQHKLSPEQVEDARRLFEDSGWRILWISTFFSINHRAIYFYIKSHGWIRRVRVAKYMPDEIARIYRERKKEKNRESLCSYSNIKQGSIERTGECVHGRWIKRCSLCGKILGSEVMG